MMRRIRLAVPVGILLTLFSAGLAQERPPTIEPAGAPAAARPAPKQVVSAKRKRVEDALKAPLALPLEDRDTITLNEFLQHVREQHRLAIRLDLPTLKTLSSGTSSGACCGASDMTGIFSSRGNACGGCGVFEERIIHREPLGAAPPHYSAPAQYGPPAPYSPPGIVSPAAPAAAYSVEDSPRTDAGPGAAPPASIVPDRAILASEEKTLTEQLAEDPKTALTAGIDKKRASGILRALTTAKLDARQIKVTVKGREVLLKGTVPSLSERTRVTNLVELLASDCKVRCDLVVADSRSTASAAKGAPAVPAGLPAEDSLHPPPAPPGTWRTAGEIASERIGAQIVIRLIGDGIELTGFVPTEAERKKAEKAALEIFGVMDVENKIAVSIASMWQKDYATAEAEAKRRGVPLVLCFSAIWCGPCRQMDSDVLNDAQVVAAMTRAVGARIDIDQDKELAKRFNISSIPAIVIMDPDGDELSRLVGTQSKAGFMKTLSGLTSHYANDGAVPAAAEDVFGAPSSQVGASSVPRPGALASDRVTGPPAAARPSSPAPGASSLLSPPRPPAPPGAGYSCPVPAPPANVQISIGCCAEPAPDGASADIDALRNQKIAVVDLALEDATIESALRQILEAIAPPSQDSDTGVPVRLTCMYDLDYLVQDDGVLITTKLAANLRKETRVYRVPVIPNCPPEALARVISHTVRPWSWRSQATDIAQQFVAQWPKSAKLPIQLDLEQGLKLASGETGGKDDALTADGIAALGPMLSAGGVVMVQAGIAALEIMHHGDPPTGVIQTLPGMLIITQTQSAHREISELLEQLGEAARP